MPNRIRRLAQALTFLPQRQVYRIGGTLAPHRLGHIANLIIYAALIHALGDIVQSLLEPEPLGDVQRPDGAELRDGQIKVILAAVLGEFAEPKRGVL